MELAPEVDGDAAAAADASAASSSASELESDDPIPADLGRLVVTSNFRAAIYINGRRVGFTPLKSPLDLEAGTYEIRAVAMKSGKSQKLQARVDAGKLLKVPFEF